MEQETGTQCSSEEKETGDRDKVGQQEMGPELREALDKWEEMCKKDG